MKEFHAQDNGPYVTDSSTEPVPVINKREIQVAGQLECEAIESLLVGYLIRDPDVSRPAGWESENAKVVASHGIKGSWFKNHGLGETFDFLMDRFQSTGELLTAEEFAAARRVMGLTKDKAAVEQSDIKGCATAVLACPIKAALVCQLFSNRRLMLDAHGAYSDMKARCVDDRFGPAKAVEEFKRRVLAIPAPDGPTRPLPFETSCAVPKFPLAALPASIGRFCEAVAASAECPVDLSAQAVLATVAAAAVSRASLDWGGPRPEPMTLFLIPCAAPSERKSTVFNAVVDPLLEAEAVILAAAAPIRAKWRQLGEILQMRLDEAKRKAAKDSSVEHEALRLAGELELHEDAPPPNPRLRVQDVTPEELATLLAEHGPLALLSTESILPNLMPRYGKAPVGNNNIYLAVWSGDPFQVDRRGRHESLRPLLVICSMCQPEALSQFVQHVAGARGTGLLSRFLFAVPESLVGKRTLDGAAIPDELLRRWRGQVFRLLSLDQGVMKLSPKARELQTSFARELEEQMAPGGDLHHLADWAGKMQRGQSSRIAGLLHLLEHAKPYDAPVSAETMSRALAICHYYVAHARRAFQLLRPEPRCDMPLARRIAAWSRKSPGAEVRPRTLMANFHVSKAELQPVLDLLIERAWLLPTKANGQYRVNPLEPEVEQGLAAPIEVTCPPAECPAGLPTVILPEQPPEHLGEKPSAETEVRPQESEEAAVWRSPFRDPFAAVRESDRGALPDGSF